MNTNNEKAPTSNDNYNNILTWIDNDELQHIIDNVAEELKLKIIKPSCDTDIIVAKFCVGIIDPKKIPLSSLHSIIEVLCLENPKEFAIFLTTKPEYNIPQALKKVVIRPKTGITYEFLKQEILKKQDTIYRRTNSLKPYNTRLHRITYMLSKMRDVNSIIYYDEICKRFAVSRGIIQKDVNLLWNMGEAVSENKENTGFGWF